MNPKAVLKKALLRSGAWEILKFVLPKYHRPGLNLLRAKMRRAAGADPRLAGAYLAWADVEVYQDRWHKVVSACDNALGADPSCAEALRRRNEALLRLGGQLMRDIHDQTSSEKAAARIAAAAAHFEAALAGPPGDVPGRTKAREELFTCYAMLDRWDDINRLNNEALSECAEAKQTVPSSAAALRIRDNILLSVGGMRMKGVQDHNRPEKSLQQINSAVANYEAILNAPDGDARHRARAREELAYCYALLGRWDDIDRLNRGGN